MGSTTQETRHETITRHRSLLAGAKQVYDRNKEKAREEYADRLRQENLALLAQVDKAVADKVPWLDIEAALGMKKQSVHKLRSKST